jgi:hypothetical protein
MIGKDVFCVHSTHGATSPLRLTFLFLFHQTWGTAAFILAEPMNPHHPHHMQRAVQTPGMWPQETYHTAHCPIPTSPSAVRSNAASTRTCSQHAHAGTREHLSNVALGTLEPIGSGGIKCLCNPIALLNPAIWTARMLDASLSAPPEHGLRRSSARCAGRQCCLLPVIVVGFWFTAHLSINHAVILFPPDWMKHTAQDISEFKKNLGYKIDMHINRTICMS